jgi:hypothetical protein
LRRLARRRDVSQKLQHGPPVLLRHGKPTMGTATITAGILKFIKP